MSEALVQAIDQQNYYKALVFVLLLGITGLVSAVIYLYKNPRGVPRTHSKPPDKVATPTPSSDKIKAVESPMEALSAKEIQASLQTCQLLFQTLATKIEDIGEVLDIIKEGLVKGPKALDDLTAGIADQASSLRGHRQTTSEKLNTCVKILTEIREKFNGSKTSDLKT